MVLNFLHAHISSGKINILKLLLSVIVRKFNKLMISQLCLSLKYTDERPL